MHQLSFDQIKSLQKIDQTEEIGTYKLVFETKHNEAIYVVATVCEIGVIDNIVKIVNYKPDLFFTQHDLDVRALTDLVIRFDTVTRILR